MRPGPGCGHGAVQGCSSMPEHARLTQGVRHEPQVFCTVQSLHRSITNVSVTIKRFKRIFKPSGSAQLLVSLPAFSKEREARRAGWSGGSREATRYLPGGFMILMWICSTFNWNSLRIHGAENVRRSGNEGFERPNVSCK